MQENIPLNIRIMIEACRKAEKIITKNYWSHDIIKTFDKGEGEGVYTEADVRVESVLKTELAKAKPGCGFICEESGELEGDSDIYFIIDPIDGTSNFIRRIPFFTISIAMLQVTSHSRNVIAGMIYAPILREIYWAVKGRGAYAEFGGMRTTRIRAGTRKTLDGSLILFMPTSLRRAENFIGFVGQCRVRRSSMRALGSAALSMAYVASGRADAFFGGCLKIWDVAAGSVIIKEAGGLINGYECDVDSKDIPEIVCSGSDIHSRCLALLNGT